jgi:hypothetical protein
MGPDERIRIARYVITQAIGKGIDGLQWVGLYGSFKDLRVLSPRDIDLALDVSTDGLSQTNARLLPALRRAFGLPVDVFPVSMAKEQYGTARAAELVEKSLTVYGSPPQVRRRLTRRGRGKSLDFPVLL